MGESNSLQQADMDMVRLSNSDLEATLTHRESESNLQENSWTVAITKAAEGLESLAVGIKNEQGEFVKNINVNGVQVEAEAEGVYLLKAHDSQIEFTAQKGLEVTVDIFKFIDGKRFVVGTLKSNNQEGEINSDVTSESNLSSNTNKVESDTSPSEEKNMDEDTTAETSNTGESEEPNTPDLTQESSNNENSTSSIDQEAITSDSLAPRSKRSAEPLISGNTGNPEIPKGAILLDGVFGDINVAGNKGNSGVHTIQDSNVNNGMPYSEITLSGSKNWLSIWSNDQYRMDFSKSFYGRTYINFGSGADADGLAFVMQNAGSKALTTANGSDDGQNLGVYGVSTTGLLGWDKPEAKAIQKSVAIEFDLFSNADGKHMFDNDNKITPHMAYSFPGSRAKGYKSTSLFGENYWGSNDKVIVRHNNSQKLNGVVGDNIRDNTWYEFRYDFDEPSKTFSYYLKNPITEAKTPIVTIPWSDLSSELGLSESNNKAYWGFTGANGSASGQVKFVFTQVPVDLSAKIGNDVLSNDDSVVDTEDHEQYEPQLPAATDQEPLTFKTRFTVAEGEAGLKITKWQTYVSSAQFDLSHEPKEITALLGTRTYSGTSIVNPTTGEIQITFPDLDVHPGEEVYMSYTLDPVKHSSAEKAYFSSRVSTSEIGNNTASDFLGQQVSFWIKGNQAPILSNLLAGKGIFTDYLDVFQYSFKYKDADKDKLILQTMINGIEVSDRDELQSEESDQNYEKTFSQNINLLDANQLFKVGINTLRVSLDDGVNPPVTEEITFEIQGYFGFEELTKNYSWKFSRTELNSNSTPMPRENQMKVKIRDTRNLGQSKPVRISLNATSDDVALSNERFTFDNQTLDNLELPTNQELVYENDKGLLLKLSNKDTVKEVHGKITWTIVDAP